MNSLRSDQDNDIALVQAEEHAIWLICGWALPIIERVEKYRIDAIAGVFDQEGKSTQGK